MRLLYEQYRYNVGRSDAYVGEDGLPDSPAVDARVRLIAYYLPQFHAIAENDAWWGKGFTEWTNVTKALPRYVGHEQPRLPGDLGFYDLRDADVLRRQAALARRGGIHGFCIHHYWFSGRQVLETPLNLLLANPDIDLPFCLNWANENWTRRWDGLDADVLLEQKYASGDAEAFAESILPALRDPRYIRIDGRPLLMVYRPAVIPDMQRFVATWRDYFVKAGVGDPYMVMAQAYNHDDPRPFGMDGAAGFPPHNSGYLGNDRNSLKLIDSRYEGTAIPYAKVASRALAKRHEGYRHFPGICPRWDNEARKPERGFSLYGTSPARYGAWLDEAARAAMTAPSADERIVFINAWNEWAEGAYLEPDRHHGYAYLAETRRVLDGLATGGAKPSAGTVQGEPGGLGMATPRIGNRIVNLARRGPRKIGQKLFKR